MGSRRKFLITHTSEYVLSANDYVVHVDLSADYQTTELKEYWTLAPKIHKYYSGHETKSWRSGDCRGREAQLLALTEEEKGD